MASKLNVEVVSPERRLFSAPADEVIAPGADGLFGVRPGHTAYLALLQPGVLSVTDAGTTKRFFVSGGFVDAGPERVRVLASAEPLETIDLAQAKKRFDAAKQKLEATSPSVPEYAKAQQQLVVETRRVEAVEKR